MKIFILCLSIITFLSSPPKVYATDNNIQLGLGGYVRSYINYTDESTPKAVDLLRDSEVHFKGKTTLNNGLTVGVHIEASSDGADGFDTNESFIYLSGAWGRVNIGEEDGAAFLLQVAAPSADDIIDGIRPNIRPSSLLSNNDYANDAGKDFDKFTYLSPIISGLQIGTSYTFENTNSTTGGNRSSSPESDIIEGAVRYEYNLTDNAVLTSGGGYTFVGDADFQEWNIATNLKKGNWGLGGVYTSFKEVNDKTDTFVVGAEYTIDAIKIGASYFDSRPEIGSDNRRYTAGAIYDIGEGLSFRGSLSYRDTSSNEATTISIGTQINF